MKMNKSGISLIVLVVTIIVLAILAAVVVISIVNSGLVNSSKDSVKTYELAQLKSLATVAWEEALLDQNTNTPAEYASYIKAKLLDAGYTEKELSKYTILADVNNVTVYEYEMKFYSDLLKAITTINDESYEDDSLTTTQDLACVGMYKDENNIPHIRMLKNQAIDIAVELESDMVLELNGKTLSLIKENAINITAGNIVINGSVSGSKISVANNDQRTTIATVNAGSLTLNGGKYETTSNGVGNDSNPNASIIVGSTGKLNAQGIELIASDENGATLVGILIQNGGEASISNSDIYVTSLNGLKSDGIRNFGTATLINTNVAAYSNYTANAAKTDYATSTRGIDNEGIMVLKNCYVYGCHSGVRSMGTLYIDGGTYEGYGHGGIYYGGSQTISYAKNAIIRLCDMKNGYDDGVAGTNKAGFYIGGASNVTVYMDKCDLYGSYYPAVLRSSGGEKNNALYISNSKVNENMTKYIRNDGSTNKVYIGTGNNFTTSNVYKSSYAVSTTEDYGLQFPEY